MLLPMLSFDKVFLVNFEVVVDISSLDDCLVKDVSYFYLNLDLILFVESFLETYSSSIGFRGAPIETICLDNN